VPDDHCHPSTALATIQPAFTDPERLALAGFLAGFRGLTREAYALDLRQFTSWCRIRSLALFAVRRADIEHLGLERGHRTLTITRKGAKVVTVPLAPRTARAIDLAVGERTDGPVFLAADGRRLDRHGAGRIVRKTARRAGIAKTVTPHTLRHAFITAALDAGVPLRDVQEAASHADPRTTMRYDRARGSLDRHATYIVAAYVAGAAR
jgi:site-specific recombinase XerD